MTTAQEICEDSEPLHPKLWMLWLSAGSSYSCYWQLTRCFEKVPSNVLLDGNEAGSRTCSSAAEEEDTAEWGALSEFV